VVEAFVRWAGRTGFKLKKPPVESRGDDAVLTPDEMRKLVGAADPEFAAFLKLLWLCGCRPSEAQNMTVENVNWGAGVAVLKEHKTAKKSGKNRLIPLSPDALAVIECQRAKHQSGHLFRSGATGGPYRRWEVGRLMRQTRKRAGVRDAVSLYGSRHTFAATLVKQGVSTARVATILGHTSSAMVEKVYGHLSSDMQGLREVAAKVTG
jgi:integrase